MTETRYAVSRTDGDRLETNLSLADAAELICAIAWECPRSASRRPDLEIVELAMRGEIRATCMTMEDYEKGLIEE